MVGHYDAPFDPVGAAAANAGNAAAAAAAANNNASKAANASTTNASIVVGSRGVSATTTSVPNPTADYYTSAVTATAHTSARGAKVATESEEEATDGGMTGDDEIGGGAATNKVTSGESTFQALKAMVEEARYAYFVDRNTTNS